MHVSIPNSIWTTAGLAKWNNRNWIILMEVSFNIFNDVRNDKYIKQDKYDYNLLGYTGKHNLSDSDKIQWEK